MIEIGEFRCTSRVFLAPIAGYTDLSFRSMVRATGFGGLVYTELLNSRGILSQKESSVEIGRIGATDQPIGIQLYGNDVEWFVKAAQWAEGQGVQLIDINMGCPVDKVTKTNGGSMLLCDPDATVRMVERIVKAVSVPVTAKLRLGWDSKHITAPRLARLLEEVGVRLITIHGRTTKMRFKGSIDLDGIGQVVNSVVSIPVIGNGDIKSVEDAVHMMNYTGCAGVMVARGAIKRPWLLYEIDYYLDHGCMPAEMTVLDKTKLVRLHFDNMIRFRDERYAVRIMRGRISGYSVSMGHIKPVREKIRLMKSVREFYEAMDLLESRVESDWVIVPAGIINIV